MATFLQGLVHCPRKSARQIRPLSLLYSSEQQHACTKHGTKIASSKVSPISCYWRTGDPVFHASLISRSFAARSRGSFSGFKCTTVCTSVGAPADFAKMTASMKVQQLRELMADSSVAVDAYIIPSEDAHLSEYVADCFSRRVYISGFTGSAGIVAVTKDQALLWTDGRYFLQAENQLDSSCWTLMRAGIPGTPSLADWLAQYLPEGARIGVDPMVLSLALAKQIKAKIETKKQQLVPIPENLVDKVWGDERPPAPQSVAFEHPVQYAGLTVQQKVASIREQIVEAGADVLAVTALDEIAWLLNMRGADVPYNPVLICFAIVTPDNLYLYVDSSKVEGIRPIWGTLVTLRPYEAFIDDVSKIASSGKRFLIDPAKSTLAIVNAVPAEQVIEKPSPVVQAKAIKNDAELNGMRQAHIRDGVALAKFLCWLEGTVASDRQITEVEVAEHLEAYRREQTGFVSPSFPTIAGSGANGAIIHYQAEPSSCAVLSTNELFLLDSGAQYRDGTTDVTRTLHFGSPSQRQRECFTRVLKGHISLATAVFPNGITGWAVDILARRSLWSVGLDYRHGTGHGVGAFLNVHEGPQSISQRPIDVPLVPGMVVSNEPGYYEDGSFGIRIENLIIVRKAETPNNFGNVGYLGFETLTLVPIQRKMIDLSILNPEEAAWIDSYHRAVLDTIGPFLSGQELAWLRDACAPLGAGVGVGAGQANAAAGVAA